ncbi:MAG: hypothetical protein ACKO16_07315 [Gemmataceae bacterium]
MFRMLFIVVLAVSMFGYSHGADNLPLVFEDNFGKGMDHWSFSDSSCWKIVELKDGSKALSQFKKVSSFKPPHRSPYHFALVKDLVVEDFVLETKMLSTIKDYNHRDLCLFFGYQDPAHFYYVHLGKKTDDHANQIFIVDGSDRKKISIKTTPGTNWTESWHKARIKRDIKSGSIEVFFDDMSQPVMTANNKNFTWGKVGVGSFDDTGDWADVKIFGVKAKGK